MNEDATKFQIILYDGSIESYNKLIDFWEKKYKLNTKNLFHSVMWLDENFHSTNKFTGIVGSPIDGVIMRPGDYYKIEIGEIA